MSASKTDRFQEFLRRLERAPRVTSCDQAFALLRDTLKSVEDELTDIPYRPKLWQTDGRMYPPEEDSARSVEGRSDLIRYRNKGHNTIIRDNGAIAIQDLMGSVLFEKPGVDGRGVELQQPVNEED